MGLLDELLKDGADILKEAASDENKEKATELLNSLKDNLEKHAADLKDLAESFRKDAGNGSKEETEYKESSCKPAEEVTTSRERILGVLKHEFPNYTVKENVSPTTFGGQGRFMDCSIVVYETETPKLIIMLIGKTTTAHREYHWSREEAEKRGYPFINFVKHYPNTPEYISNRLHKYL